MRYIHRIEYTIQDSDGDDLVLDVEGYFNDDELDDFAVTPKVQLTENQEMNIWEELERSYHEKERY